MLEKLMKAIHEGKVTIGEKTLNCAVLEDGTRVLAAKSVFEAFDRPRKGKSISENRVTNMPSFLDANNLQPFVSRDLRAWTIPIKYQTISGGEGSGYDAKILPAICKVYLDARATRNLETNKTILTKSQEPLARASEILLLGLSNIGITALIDEATGYQYEREKDELQKILSAYIAEELLPWQKRFPDEFYKEIFRLNGWDYTVKGIKQRPGVIGTWTNKFVYEQLPKGVLQELKLKTPKNEEGRYKAKLHQSLTTDIGNPHLEKQLISVVTLMNVSNNWSDFIRLFNKKFGQQEIDFPEFKEINEGQSISFGNALRKIGKAGKPITK